VLGAPGRGPDSGAALVAPSGSERLVRFDKLSARCAQLVE